MKDADDRTGGLRQGEIRLRLISVDEGSYIDSWKLLTTETKSGASMKRQIRPSDIRERRTFPSLRAKLHGVLAIDIFASVHVVNRESNSHSTANKNRRASVRTTPSRQPSRFPSKSDIYGNRRVKPQSWRSNRSALVRFCECKPKEQSLTLVKNTLEIGHSLNM